jgi:very-short-patch-repair endonuclease
MYKINNKAELKNYRKSLRQKMTKAEIALWSKIKNSQIAGHKFRRQYSIGFYILDFYCTDLKLAIELDG